MQEQVKQDGHDSSPDDGQSFDGVGRREFMAKLLALGAGTAGFSIFGSAALAAEPGRWAPQRETYDYVIVGAGSAGCLLADRLSATGASVLLIEAGSDRVEQPKIREVALWQQNLFSDTDWARQSTPQAYLDNRQQAVAAGKIVGGSGSINAMIWLRGDPRDLHQWHRQVGQEWNPQTLHRAYLKVVDAGRSGHGAYGTAGRITVGRYADEHPLTAAYLAASAATGLRTIELNAGHRLDGAGVAEVNASADGYRVGPAQAMLLPALARPNLKVLPNALITRLILQGAHCRGVEVVVDGEPTYILASRETIVCAGACASPKILMLSGLGPADQLAALGVKVRQDMPAVGRNLQDHVLVSLQFRSKVRVPQQVSNGVSSMSYYSNSSAKFAPDVQIAGMQYPFGPLQVPAGSSYTVIPFLAKPRSRGSVRLASSDPRQSLIIDPHYLEERIDRDNMVFALERALDIGSNQGMREFYAGLYTSDPLRTYEDKLAFIARSAGSGLHFMGTCIAGRDPATSVVDANFRVWGVEGLRVVDASVLPEMPAVNIQASVLTVAQLAADQLIGEARAGKGVDAYSPAYG